MSFSMKDFALSYIRRFGAIVPIRAWGNDSGAFKAPLIKGWTENPLTTEEEVEEMWTRYPSANIGLVTGQKSGGILVLDFDVKPELGISGLESLRNWELETGLKLPSDTWTAITGSGGAHWFFHTDKYVKGFSCCELGIDVRCDGNQIVLPPSVHKNGRRYEWEYSPKEFDLLEADDVVFKFLDYLKSKTQGSAKKFSNSNKEIFQLPEEVPQGERVSTMVRLAAVLTSIGISDVSIEETIRNENYCRCNPPLGDKELQKQVFPAVDRFRRRREEEAWKNLGFRNTQQKSCSQKQNRDLLLKLKKQVQAN